MRKLMDKAQASDVYFAVNYMLKDPAHKISQNCWL